MDEALRDACERIKALSRSINDRILAGPMIHVITVKVSPELVDLLEKARRVCGINRSELIRVAVLKLLLDTQLLELLE